MHELSITGDILNLVLKYAHRHRLTRVERVFLQIGALSDLEPEWIQRYFTRLAKETPAAEALIVVERVPCRFRCNTCGDEFDLDLTRSERAFCPGCSSSSIAMISGDEYLVKSMEGR